MAQQPDDRWGSGVTIRVGVAVLALALGGLGLLGPDLTVGPSAGHAGMRMTHYMELLSLNQPWNLLLFMGVPVVLAETLTICELVLLLRRDSAPRWVVSLSRVAGLLAGPVMIGIVLQLLDNAVVPLTLDRGWRGPLDWLAVGSYLLGAVPFVGITLTNLGLVGRTPRQALRWHAAFIAAFLVVAHVAMIVGMLDPGLAGYRGTHG